VGVLQRSRLLPQLETNVAVEAGTGARDAVVARVVSEDRVEALVGVAGVLVVALELVEFAEDGVRDDDVRPGCGCVRLLATKPFSLKNIVWFRKKNDVLNLTTHSFEGFRPHRLKMGR
jgi:hypothetical protein